MKYLCSIILSLIACGVAAKDFGIQGHIYEIAEESILKVIQQRLAKIDIKKLNQKMQERTKAYVERPTAVKGITKASEGKNFYYDPTFTLEHDIKDHNGQLIYKAGTQVNPLDHLPLRQALLFIDGDDQQQVEFALQNDAKIILVKGSPLQLQKKYKNWIYFDQGGFITYKLGITQVPALVEQVGLKLRIRVMGGEKL